MNYKFKHCIRASIAVFMAMIMLISSFASVLAFSQQGNVDVGTVDGNLLQNPGFEDGTWQKDSWVSQADEKYITVTDSSTVQNGQKALKLEMKVAVNQKISNLDPNTMYVLEGDFATENGSVVNLGVDSYGNNKLEKSIVNSPNGMHEQILFTTGSSNREATIFIYKPAGEGAVYVDSMSVKKVSGVRNLALDSQNLEVVSLQSDGYTEAHKPKENSVDGNNATSWANYKDVQWEIDLLETKNIYALEMLLEKLSSGIKYKVYTSQNKADWTLQSDHWDSPVVTGDNITQEIFEDTVKARYVRLQLSAPNEWPCFYEIRLFGADVVNNAPTLASLFPSNGEKAAPEDSNLVIGFDRNVTVTSDAAITIYNAKDNQLIETISGEAIAVNGAQVTINPQNNLTPDNTYYVHVAPNSFEDAQGYMFEGITDTATWGFSVKKSDSSGEILGRKVVNFNGDWKFLRGDVSGSENPTFDDTAWEKVSLPHTFKDETKDPGTNWYRGIGWYRKNFTVDPGYKDKKVFINFEAAMQVAEVWVNGTKVGEHVFGYTPFGFDITAYLNFEGENVIAVKANNQQNNQVPPESDKSTTDYILPGGLYRDAYLVTTEKIYVPDAVAAGENGGGVFVKYPAVSTTSAKVDVTTWVKNEYNIAKNATVVTQLIDAGGTVQGQAESTISISAGQTVTFKQDIDINNPNLWSPAIPYMYTLKTIIKEGTQVLDEYTTKTGIRKIEFKKDNGFYINGQSLKLFGLNRHQMWPYIGGAAPNSLQRMDAQLLKDAGVNFVRTSHYVQDPEFLNACDELGILVWEEAPGGSWSYQTTPPTDTVWRNNAKNSIKEMVRRDRNRPSIIVWGSLNEAGQDSAWENEVNSLIKSLDSTRYTSGSRNYNTSNNIFDIYGHNAFESLPGSNPDQGTQGYIDTEHTGHTFVTSRFDSEQRLLEQAGKHEYMTEEAHKRNWVAGGAGWSFTDYSSNEDWGIGTLIRYHGVMDIFRIPKFAYYFYASQRDKNDPMVYIANYWTKNSPTDVKVYSNCDKVRLSKWNGTTWEVFATQESDSRALENPPFTFNVGAHETDRLMAEGIIGNRIVTSHEVKTPQIPSTLSLETSQPEINADGSDISRVLVYVKDQNGTVIPDADNAVNFTIDGPGELVGDNPVKVEAGIYGILVRATEVPGTITVSANVPAQKVNLAINKVVLSNSQESSNPAANAVDGNIATRWCASNGNAGNWIQVDLGAVKNLTGAEITWEQGSVYKYKIETSTDGNKWNTAIDKTNNTSNTRVQESELTSNNTDVRYVRVIVTGLESGIWASISELKLFDGTEINLSAATVKIESKSAGTTITPVKLPTPWKTGDLGQAGIESPGNTTYYVDSVSGSDSNDGISENTPWKTLDKVNNTIFAHGDKILFKSGSLWSGKLWPKGSGTDGSPVVIDKYGEGNKPVINGGGVDTAIYLFNQEYWEINNLEVTNKGTSVGQRRAIGIFASDYGTVNHVYVRNCYIHDVNGSDDPERITVGGFTMEVKWTGGIIYGITGDKVKTKYNDVLIENNTIKNVDRTGLRAVESSWFNRDNVNDSFWCGSTGVVIKNNYLENIGGDGIVAQTADRPLIEYNVAKDCHSRSAYYNVAIWNWSTETALFQYNEAYLTHTTRDGQGFDCDYYANETTFQYNYSHDNEGGFMLICSPGEGQVNHNSVVRYNISQNDRNRIFQVNGPATRNTKVYNNTIYVGPQISNSKIFLDSSWNGYSKEMEVKNNIFYILNGEAKIDDKAEWVYDNNLYYGVTPPAEDENAITQDPKFVNPGSGGTGRKTVSGYKLQPDSPAIDKGKTIPGSSIPCTTDYFGNKLFNGATDIGAHEYSGDSGTPPVEPANIALNKAVKTSSQEASNPASNAVDGKLITRWSASNGDSNWMQVDLGKNYDLSGTKVIWESNGRVYKYKIDISDNEAIWKTVVDKTNTAISDQIQEDNFDGSGRYVRITVTGFEPGIWASIYELMVFGDTSSTQYPGIAYMYPVNNAADVAKGSDLTVTFDKAIKGSAEAAEDCIKIYDKNNVVVESFSIRDVTIDQKKVTIHPSKLNFGETYYVQIAANVLEDLNGNKFPGLLSSTAWRFTLYTPTPIKIDPSAQYQKFDGWGTSLIWFANIIGGWSDAKKNEIADLLFDQEKGLGLNIVRYNIGGGDAPGHTHLREGGDIPGWATGFDTQGKLVYDWDVDKNQIWMLKAAIVRGANIKEAFSNSPPYFMTNTGCASGSVDGWANNLKDEYYDNFADYLTQVVKHIKDVEGIEFDSLNPMNEPYTNYWKANGGQEGCHFDRDKQALLIEATYNQLQKKGLPTFVSAMDESVIDTGVYTFDNYFDADTKAMMKRLNLHTYGGSNRVGAKRAATLYEKDLWMSEVDMGSGGYSPEGMTPALDLSQRINTDILEMQPSAWILWQAIENWPNMLPRGESSQGGNWGLIFANFEEAGKYGSAKVDLKAEDYKISKKYYGMMQYTKFIKQGFTLIGTTGNDNILAFYNKDTKRLVYVVRNADSTGKGFMYDLSGFNTVGTGASVYRTSSTENFQKLKDIVVEEKNLNTWIEANSITTFVIDGVTYDDSVIKVNDTTIGDTDNKYEFVGGWDYIKEINSYTKDNAWSTANDSKYKVEFVGNQIKLYGAKASNHGIARVSITDGAGKVLVQPQDVDFYSSTRKDKELIYTSPVLVEGKYTLLVESTGRKNASSAGTTIIADYSEVFKSKQSTDVSVEGVSLDKTILSLAAGGTQKLNSTVLPINATNRNVIWSSSNVEVATVDATGMVTAKKAGNTTITVTTVDGNKNAACVVNVNEAEPGPGPGPGTDPGTGTNPGTGSNGSGTGTAEQSKIEVRDDEVFVIFKPVVEGNKSVSAVDVNTVEKAFAKAKEAADGTKTITMEIPKADGVKTYSQELPVKVVAADAKERMIIIETPSGTVKLPGNMFAKEKFGQDDSIRINVGVADKTGIEEAVKGQIGNRPIIEVFVTQGSKRIEWKNPEAPVTVSVDYKPSAEELKDAEHIVVWYIDGAGKIISVPNGKYDPTTKKVTFTTTHFSKFAVVYVKKTFDDLQNYSWAKKQVEVMASKGIISGTGANKYSPQANITRADFITLLVKTLELQAEFGDNFSDVKVTDYYYTSTGIAKKLGITTGSRNNKFNPKEFITRQDMFVMLEKALRLKGIISEESNRDTISKYKDVSEISQYAVDSMALMVGKGIVKGSNNMLRPKYNTTRAEVAAILYSVYNESGKISPLL